MLASALSVHALMAGSSFLSALIAVRLEQAGVATRVMCQSNREEGV